MTNMSVGVSEGVRAGVCRPLLGHDYIHMPTL